jgi:hypothetical protein
MLIYQRMMTKQQMWLSDFKVTAADGIKMSFHKATDMDGHTSIMFTIPKDAEPGEYKVEVKSKNYKGDETTFEVLPAKH